MNSKKMKNTRLFSTLFGLLIAGAMTVGASAQPLADWFVDGATGSDNNIGQTWPQAYATVRKALGAAGFGDVIFVAAGTYYPDEINGGNSDDREDTFSLVNGVKLYGGFLNGDLFVDRDPETNLTILSGDIDQDGQPDENSLHVVTADGVGITTIIYGFTITAGNANDPCPDCPIGPGLGVVGGGMLVMNASPIVFRCSLEGNQASDLGGAMAIVDGSPAVILCTFTLNSAPGHGGGAMHIQDSSHPLVVNCSMTANDGSFGGAMHIDPAPASATLINCLLSGNTATASGGAIDARSGEPATLDLINCTVADNTAQTVGGGIWVAGTIAVTITNSIFWDNLPDQIFGAATVTYSDVEGGWAGEGNLDPPLDPLFFDPVNGNYRLAAGSPCIDKGNNADVPCDQFDVDEDGDDCATPQDTPDLDLGVRILDGDEILGADVDMGPYESVPCPWDLNDDCVVGAFDLLDLLFNWGPCPGCAADFDGDDIVGASDLLALLFNWGPCPCDPTAVVPSIEDEMAAHCLTMTHWDDFEDVMTDPQSSQAKKDNYLCWMLHYLEDCSRCFCIGESGCPDDDPFNG